MLRGYVIDVQDGRQAAVAGTFVIGRTRDCDLSIDDSSASRRHVEITARADGFVWKDLGSTNGTLINGNRMLAGELNHGDEIQIGETVIRFEIEEVADEAEIKDDSRLFQETILNVDGVVCPAPDPSPATGLLEAVCKVMSEIATNYDPCGLLDRILETTLKAIDGQRGAVFLGGDADNLLPCPECGHVHCIRDGKLGYADGDEIRISRTVAGRVLRGGESVLFQDNDQDSELSAADSILSLALRSIVCVPLRAKGGILGVLYIDTDREDQSYTREDMLLASAMGNSAGIALENARMHSEVLEKQRMEQEIDTAWTIQEGFLVKDWPENDSRFEVYGITHPAKTVGGDFYDFVRPRPNTAGILIGDVSGKGVPAALTMAQLLAEFRLIVREHESPAAILHALNTGLVARAQRGLFCTLCYLSLDLGSGKVTCANAGHSPALHVGSKGVTPFGEASGPPAGILAGASWTDVTLNVAQGDQLLLYTDGVTEGRSTRTALGAGAGGMDEYGSARVCTVAAQKAELPPKTLIEAIVADVRRFCEPLAPHDDCTLVALRYGGHGH